MFVLIYPLEEIFQYIPMKKKYFKKKRTEDLKPLDIHHDLHSNWFWSYQLNHVYECFLWSNRPQLFLQRNYIFGIKYIRDSNSWPFRLDVNWSFCAFNHQGPFEPLMSFVQLSWLAKKQEELNIKFNVGKVKWKRNPKLGIQCLEYNEQGLMARRTSIKVKVTLCWWNKLACEQTKEISIRSYSKHPSTLLVNV